jgi:hypothetical protein
VDGGPQAGTVLTLSHWPATPSPPQLAEDTSAGIVLRFLRGGAAPRGVEAVTNDHLDQDGIVSVLAMTEPELALERRSQLEDVASAGDFATFDSRGAARVSFALASLADPERSVLGRELFTDDHWDRCAGLYAELLGLLPELIADPYRFGSMWEEEDASLEDAQRAVDSAEISVEERPDLDLAIVTVPEGRPQRLATRFASRADASVHPAAVRNRTRCLRLLVLQGARYELVYRYESWVRYMSRRPLPRVDLGPLAEALSAEEREGPPWRFDGVGALEPSLRRGEDSSLAPGRFRELVEGFLVRAKPAWDPYRDAGSGALVG